MENSNLIPVIQFCDCHQIEFSFIYSLQEYGLVDVRRVDEQEYLEKEQLPELESMVRMYHDLGLNFEALDVISNLLLRIRTLQKEVKMLQNRLELYS